MKGTRRFLVSLLCGLALLGTVVAADAGSILYFNDYNISTDRMAQALADLQNGGIHSVTTVTSSSAFATQIATGVYDLGILFVQDATASSYAAGITALGNFVSGGGSAIYTDWSRDSNYTALFGASWTSGTNDSTITITNPQLGAGITNPVALTNPGWGIFSMDVTGSAIAATFSDGAGAIALSGKSIVNGFLSDTFSDGAAGVQLYKNEIGYLLGSQAVPEPSTFILLGAGLAGAFVFRKRMKQ